MKKRILMMTTLMLCLSMLLASCGLGSAKNATPSDIYAEDYQLDKTPSLTKGEKLNFTDATVIKNAGNLVAFLDGEGTWARYRVYNLLTNTVVLEFVNTLEDFSTIDITLVDDQAVFSLTKITSKEQNKLATYFYDANGNLIKAVDDAVTATVNADLLEIDHCYYRFENGVFALKIERSKLAGKLPTFSAWNDTYYYVLNSSSDITVYSNAGEVVSAYSIPLAGEMSGIAMSVLENGNVLIQSMMVLPEDATEFDLYYNSEKADIYTSIYNAKSGKAKEIELDFVVAGSVAARGVSGNDMEGYSDKILNVATILEIKNQRVDTNQVMFVSMDNNAKIKMVLNHTLKEQKYNGTPAIPVAADRYVLSALDGGKVIVNGKGEKLGDVKNLKDDFNNLYFIAAGCIYNISDLALVYDFEKDGYSFLKVMDNAVILFKTEESGVKYFIFKQGDTAPVAIEYEGGDGNYYVAKAGNEYIYYNDSGVEIFRADEKATAVVTATDDNNLVVLLQSEKNFYRLAVN